DLVFHGHGDELEFDLDLAPGADPKAIGLNFSGIDKLDVDAEGNAVLGVKDEEILVHGPTVYQPGPNGRREVIAHYARRGPQTLGIELGSYDRERAVVIDPVINYAGYLGGLVVRARALAVDAAGHAFVTGDTCCAADFPTTPGAFMTAFKGAELVYVSEFSSDGKTLLYSTYLGGDQYLSGYPGTAANFPFGIALDGTGNVYVAGWTNAVDFPAKNTAVAGGYQYHG